MQTGSTPHAIQMAAREAPAENSAVNAHVVVVIE
jgi:hypothetical protein